MQKTSCVIGENGVTSENVSGELFLFRLCGFLGNFAFSPLIFNRFVRETMTFLSEDCSYTRPSIPVIAAQTSTPVIAA